MDDAIRRIAEQDGELDEHELRRRYYERLSDWSELDAVKVVCDPGAADDPGCFLQS